MAVVGCSDGGPFPCKDVGCPAPLFSCAFLATNVLCRQTISSILRPPPPGVAANQLIADACPFSCGTCENRTYEQKVRDQHASASAAAVVRRTCSQVHGLGHGIVCDGAGIVGGLAPSILTDDRMLVLSPMSYFAFRAPEHDASANCSAYRIEQVASSSGDGVGSDSSGGSSTPTPSASRPPAEVSTLRQQVLPARTAAAFVSTDAAATPGATISGTSVAAFGATAFRGCWAAAALAGPAERQACRERVAASLRASGVRIREAPDGASKRRALRAIVAEWGAHPQTVADLIEALGCADAEGGSCTSRARLAASALLLSLAARCSCAAKADPRSRTVRACALDRRRDP